MRKLLTMVLVTLVFGVGGLTAQNQQLLYDFYEIPQSAMLNPGVKTIQQWHAGLPLLSGLTLQAGTSGITVNDLFADDGIDFTTKLRDRAINGLGQNDEFGASGTFEVFSGGFRTANRPNDYYSFGVYGEGFISQFWPKDIAILAFEGNAPNINRRFSLNHFSNQGEAVNVFHFGLNRKLNQKWTVGARAKLYSSVFEFRSAKNDGYFVTTVGENNLLRNTLVADVRMRTSGVDELLDILTDDSAATQEELSKLLIRKSLLGGNLGLGMDFGFTHELSRQTVITGSVLDLGFIYYNKNVKNYALNGAASNEGIEIILPEDLTNLTSDIWQELVDEIERLVPFETDEDAYLAMRPIKLYGSIRHNFGQKDPRSNDCDCDIRPKINLDRFDYINSVGAQLFMMQRPRGPQLAVTAFFQKRFGNFLTLKTTYTADKYSLSNIGMGMSWQLGKFNFYAMADNLLGYTNIPDSHYASFHLGFNIISWNGN
ncbi:MAG: hypothetical protein HRT65_01520 [Flavobacteriaceae bacterium]|nr:hypothetical protein [Flavobacteriaceae bacterium]